MKIVRFLGGLGNQMFQYAFYKSLERRFGSVKADLSAFEAYDLHNGFELERIFPLTVDQPHPFLVKLYDPHYRGWLIRKLRRIANLKHAFYEEKTLFQYDARLFEDKGSRLYWGYWQNERYFDEIAGTLRQDFKFKLPLNEKNETILRDIQSGNSVSVHIRRGDYLHNELLGGICDEAYYCRAIDIISEKLIDPEFFIFSNDIAWCQSTLHLPRAKFISWNHGDQSYIDMQLMSHCKHNIIANSSFSWWSAWLNTHPGKIVIAPRRWTNDPAHSPADMIPHQWLTL
jgi:hypothetical protein